MHTTSPPSAVTDPYTGSITWGAYVSPTPQKSDRPSFRLPINTTFSRPIGPTAHCSDRSNPCIPTTRLWVSLERLKAKETHSHGLCICLFLFFLSPALLFVSFCGAVVNVSASLLCSCHSHALSLPLPPSKTSLPCLPLLILIHVCF